MKKHLNKKNKCYEYDKIFDIVTDTKKSPLEKSKETDITDLNDTLEVALERILDLETELQEYKDLLDDDDFIVKINEMKTELDNVKAELDNAKAELDNAKAELEAKDTEINEIIENRDMVINQYKDKRRSDKDKINDLTKIVLKFQERENQKPKTQEPVKPKIIFT